MERLTVSDVEAAERALDELLAMPRGQQVAKMVHVARATAEAGACLLENHRHRIHTEEHRRQAAEAVAARWRSRHAFLLDQQQPTSHRRPA